jgi:cell division protein FtsN
MRNKETGEFELVVGDRQLLSGFFIGVLLLAVVFAMGYELGQNSPKSNKVAADATATNAGDTDRPQPASPVETKPGGTVAPSTQAGETPADATPQPTTQPAREPSAPASSTAAAAPPEPVEHAAPPPVESDAANASFLQVTAQASRSSAEAVMKTLKESGFPATLRELPNKLTAVWVGPYTERKPLAEAKGKLEKAGFNPIIKKP